MFKYRFIVCHDTAITCHHYVQYKYFRCRIREERIKIYFSIFTAHDLYSGVPVIGSLCPEVRRFESASGK